MGRIVKLAVMAAALFLALYGVNTLKHRLASDNQAATSLSVDTVESVSPPSFQPRVLRPPTILQAQPARTSPRGDPSARYPSESGGFETFHPQLDAISPIVPSVPTSPAPNVAPLERQPSSEPTSFPTDDAGTPSGGFTGPKALPPDAMESATRLMKPGDSPPGGKPGFWKTGADDSLWSISLAQYGTGAYYHALFAYNRRRIRHPDRIPPDVVLEIPPVEVLRRQFPSLCPINTRLSAHSTEADNRSSTSQASSLR